VRSLHRPASPSVAILLSLLLALLLGAGAPSLRPRLAVPAGGAEERPTLRLRGTDPFSDLRVIAFQETYGALIDSLFLVEGDVVFMVRGEPIHFQDGRMLSPRRLRYAHRFDPIFYEYPLGPLEEPPPLLEDPVRSTDLLEQLFGRTEPYIREHGRSARFLDHRVFVNDFCREPLARVEEEIRTAARTDPAVAAWIAGLRVVYSFEDKEVAGSASRSYHAFGLALDLIPASYGRRQVYWKWSRVYDRQWYRIPVARRYSPPQPVIEAFEHHGFVWGGKWSHFDTIHFEYRPEILRYNELLTEAAQALYR
jgi:hypothetical protein